MNTKRTLFALFRAQGSTVSQSFVSSGFKGDRNAASKNGSKLQATPEIQSLIEELKASKTPEQIRAEILDIKAALNDKEAAQRNKALQKIATQRDKEYSHADTPKHPPPPVSAHDIRALEHCVALVVRESAAIAEEVQKLDGDPLILSAALTTHRASCAAQVEWLSRLREADSTSSNRGAANSQGAGQIDPRAAILRLEA